MNEDAIRREISGMPAMAPLSGALKAKIADIFVNNGVLQKCAANTLLFRAGDATDDQGYILLEGEIDVTKEGNPPVTAYAPDLIGEMAQLNPTRQRTATVKALTDLQVLRFSWPSITKAVQSTLSADEAKSFTDALQQHAWRHFTE